MSLKVILNHNKIIDNEIEQNMEKTLVIVIMIFTPFFFIIKDPSDDTLLSTCQQDWKTRGNYLNEPENNSVNGPMAGFACSMQIYALIVKTLKFSTQVGKTFYAAQVQVRVTWEETLFVFW